MLGSGLENLLAFASAALGALLATRFHFSHRQLCALISFAAGTLFGAAVFHIIPEGLKYFSVIATALALGSGYGLFYLVSRYVSHVCPACSASHFEEHEKETHRDASLYLLAGALTLHCIIDGLAIALGEPEKNSLPIFATVLIHKFPEGFALCALLIHGGQTKRRAVWLSIALESATLAGWLIGVVLLKRFQDAPWLDLFLIHTGGGFIFLALHALINESRKHSPVLPAAAFIAGAVLIAFIH